MWLCSPVAAPLPATGTPPTTNINAPPAAAASPCALTATRMGTGQSRWRVRPLLCCRRPSSTPRLQGQQQQQAIAGRACTTTSATMACSLTAGADCTSALPGNLHSKISCKTMAGFMVMCWTCTCSIIVCKHQMATHMLGCYTCKFQHPLHLLHAQQQQPCHPEMT